MNHVRFLGICIILAALFLSCAIVYHAQSQIGHLQSQVGRYQFHPSSPPGIIWVIDTTTGEVKSRGG